MTTAGQIAPPPALALRGVSAGYGRTTVLRDIDLDVPRGSVVALLGPNGAGKTTLLNTAAGLIRPSVGSIEIAGENVTHRRPSRRARRGLCLIPEGRGIFPSLTVKENLRLQVPKWLTSDEGEEPALQAFPALKQRLGQVAGSMSGGQQQMLAIARAWVSNPSVVLLDEVSMGLAPLIVDEIFVALSSLAKSGTSLLIVEQYVGRALEIADTVYLLDRGSIVFSGASTDVSSDVLAAGYFGVSSP